MPYLNELLSKNNEIVKLDESIIFCFLGHFQGGCCGPFPPISDSPISLVCLLCSMLLIVIFDRSMMHMSILCFVCMCVCVFVYVYEYLIVCNLKLLLLSTF